jgi:hypothetical protein
MEKLQGIFDQGFSGIYEDSSRKTMPDYLDKLAEQEKDFEPEQIEAPNITFDKDSSLSRANELTSDGSRESSKTNRFTVEKEQREAQDNKLKEIDKIVTSMQDEGFDEIQSSLLKRYSRDLVSKYLESKIKLILDKYAVLGFENLNEKQANIVEQAKIDFKIKRSMVHDILDKFSKLDYISNGIVKDYHDLLGSKRPLYIVAKFLFSLSSIKDSYNKNKETRIAFQRDEDEKVLSLRDINNNLKRNSNLQRQNIFTLMLNDYKQGVYNKLARSQIDQKMAKEFGIEKLQQFHSKFKDDITRVERFYNRQAFDTDFLNAMQQGVEGQIKPKISSLNTKEMSNDAFDLMTRGSNLDEIHVSLKKKYGYVNATQFLAEYDDRLKKHYGQLGYLFIDANIYANCKEMVDSFSRLQHAGSKLIFSLRAKKECAGCSCNKGGTCEKTGLLISNNPICRSSRAAKRVFAKASSFVPKTYIDCFTSQIKESNLELISKFALGIEAALQNEKKNIGKQASKDRTETTHVQEGFVAADSFNIDVFEEKVSSKIIEDVLKGL